MQKEILRDFRNLQIREDKTFREVCFPEKFQLQNSQKFPAAYLERKDRLFIYHEIGSGKTCTTIQIAERAIAADKYPVVIMPASLVPGFYDEVRSECIAMNPYISAEERRQLKTLPVSSREYRKIIQETNAKIDKKYGIYSFNKFYTAPPKRADVIIVDEAQNIAGKGTFYHSIAKFVAANPRAKLVLMTGTPIFDNPRELFNLLELLGVDLADLDAITDMRQIFDEKKLRGMLSGLISYYPGAPDVAFPKKIINYEYCKMSDFQAKFYLAEVEREKTKFGNIKEVETTNSFYIKSRQQADIVFPSGLAPTYGIVEMTEDKMTDNLARYSAKYARLMKYAVRREKQLIYNNFAGYCGIKIIVKLLEARGFKDFMKHGGGPKRYAIFDGNTPHHDKQKIKASYNRDSNLHGEELQIIIGSPSLRAGLSLLAGRRLHIIDSSWNWSNTEQIEGRFRRTCSHKMLPARERSFDVHYYISYVYDRKDISPENSIDLYILDRANKKEKINERFLQIMREEAVDRLLFQ